MANKKQVELIKEGVKEWNKWRREHLEEQVDLNEAYLIEANLTKADLSEADLSEADLSGANLRGANLSGANLMGARLSKANFYDADLSDAGLSGADIFDANLSEADLRGAYLIGADLSIADLIKADLRGAYFTGANLYKADFTKADLRGANLREADLREAILNAADLSGAKLNGADLTKADLSGAKLIDASIERANLVETNLNRTDLTNCRIYGIAAWNVKLDEATVQSDLVITNEDEPIITVDNLEVAQFIYLLLHNEKVRDVIDTITSKAVLILGRFTSERRAILDAIREELRNRDYLPIMFNFEGPTSRDITETVSTLAHMARFVIVDITDARSVPQELMTIVPNLPSVPVQPILLKGKDEYGMFEHFKRYPWVLSIHRYKGIDDLVLTLGEKVLAPAETKVKEVRKK